MAWPRPDLPINQQEISPNDLVNWMNEMVVIPAANRPGVVASNLALGPNIYVLVGPNGTDDTATINAGLTAARLAGGGEVWALGGANSLTYKASQVIIGSNTKLFLGAGVSVQQLASANANLVQNYALTAARTLMDAVTNGTTTLTSATAAFVAGDQGKQLWVWGADTAGEILKTTIASVTNGTTVVMANAAVQTLNPTQISVGPRDTGIVISGGTWDRGAASPSGANTSQTFRLRRLDNLTINDTAISSSAGGVRYGISLGDITDFTVERITWNHQGSDGVHVTGPARRGVIKTHRGQTGDDMVSLTPADWPNVNDVFGDIFDVSVEDIHPFVTGNTAVKALGGKNGAQVLNCKHIRIRNIGGYATNADENQGGLVWIGDDSGNAATLGGYLDDIVIENVAGNVPVSGTGKNNLVFINASNCGRIRVVGAHVDVPSGVTQHAVYLGVLANVGNLTLVDCDVWAGSTSSCLVVIDATGQALSAAQTLMMSRCDIFSPGGRSMVQLVGANAAIYRLFMDNCDMRTGYAFIESPTTGQRVDTATLSNLEAGPITFLAELAGTTALHLSNINAALSNSSLNIAHAAAAVTVYCAPNVYLNGKSVVTTGGYTLQCKGHFPVDAAKVNTKVAGDGIVNITAGSNPFALGPATHDGTNWRPHQGYMASGTAVLVAGTVTVNDANITANSIIRLYQRTPGGAHGAYFVDAITAATSFVIKSTSGTDTSTIYYEIEAY